MWDPMLSFSPWHGVTTCVIGNCGFGVAPTRPEHREIIMRTLEKVEAMSYEALREGTGEWQFETFPEYLDAIDKGPKVINVGVLLGHTPLRLYEMGPASLERHATADDMFDLAGAAPRSVVARFVSVVELFSFSIEFVSSFLSFPSISFQVFSLSFSFPPPTLFQPAYEFCSPIVLFS